jgi:hypothetical protein
MSRNSTPIRAEPLDRVTASSRQAGRHGHRHSTRIRSTPIRPYRPQATQAFELLREVPHAQFLHPSFTSSTTVTVCLAITITLTQTAKRYEETVANSAINNGSPPPTHCESPCLAKSLAAKYERSTTTDNPKVRCLPGGAMMSALDFQL